MTKTYSWKQSGREELNIELELDGQNIVKADVKSIGCLDFLRLSKKMQEQLTGDITALEAPAGSDHGAMIWRQMVATIQGEWLSPVAQEELCHCRKVNTVVVDRAIVYGAHSVEEVRKRTSANTGCGTCKEDVMSLISYRLKES